MLLRTLNNAADEDLRFALVAEIDKKEKDFSIFLK